LFAKLTCTVLGLSWLGCDQDVVIGDAPQSQSVGGMGGGGQPNPETPRVLWSASFDGGDISEWAPLSSEVPADLSWGGGSRSLEATAGRAASGGIAFTIDTTVDSPSHGSRVYREVESEPAYYSAWFQARDAHVDVSWWTVMVFQGRDESYSPDTVAYFWDIRLSAQTGDMLALELYDTEADATFDAPLGHEIRPGEWFHLEVRLDYVPPSSTHLDVYLNGAKVYDQSDLLGGPTAHLLWGIGNGADALNPTVSTVYVDDAAVSWDRIGPM
jgi:hypothetical protein